MAPLRSGRAANRANRGQAEHDIMEGLPVRQWRKQTSAINLVHPKETSIAKAAQEHRWADSQMPRGCELYPAHSQALLRQARMLKMPRANADEDGDGQDEDGEGEPDNVYVASKWTLIPREQERAEQDFLAERRKGMPSLYGTAPLFGVGMRMTKFKKTDADGTEYFLDVLLPDGATIAGEVADFVVAPTEALAPGSLVEGIGIANADGIVGAATEQLALSPVRRKPAPPKRKSKASLRARQKKASLDQRGTSAMSSTQLLNAENDFEGAHAASGAVSNMTDAAKQDAELPNSVYDHEEGSDEHDDEVGEEVEEEDNVDDIEDAEGVDADREEGEFLPTPDQGKIELHIEPAAAPAPVDAITSSTTDVSNPLKPRGSGSATPSELKSAPECKTVPQTTEETVSKVTVPSADTIADVMDVDVQIEQREEAQSTTKLALVLPADTGEKALQDFQRGRSIPDSASTSMLRESPSAADASITSTATPVAATESGALSEVAIALSPADSVLSDVPSTAMSVEIRPKETNFEQEGVPEATMLENSESMEKHTFRGISPDLLRSVEESVEEDMT